MIIVGAGGHAKVLADALIAIGCPVKGFVDVDRAKWGSRVLDLPVLGGAELILEYPRSSVCLVNGIGSVASMALRRDVYARFAAIGYNFGTVIHPSAIIAKTVQLGAGVQVMAGAVIQADTTIGENTIINTRAAIDHDCLVGRHCHIAPGCVISGGVHIEDEVHLGVGAVVRQNVCLRRAVVVGAGAVVISNFDEGKKIVGVPARSIQ